MSPEREHYLLTLLRAADRQYAREREQHGGPSTLRGTREGQAPSSISAPPKPKASPRLTTSARDVPTHKARAPKRPYCEKCQTIAVRGLWAYECGRNPRHALTTRVRKAPRVAPAQPPTIRTRTSTGRTLSDARDEAHATQVWVPTPWERAHGAKVAASKAL